MDRTKTQDQLQQPGVAIRRGRHGFFMYPRNDRYVGRCLELYGEYSEGEVAMFRQIVPAGGLVVEAGANIGALTVPLAAMVGPSGQVIAFEPQKTVFNILCGTLALNSLSNVTPIRAALGASQGSISVPVLTYGEAENYGGISLGASIPGHASESVPVHRLDDIPLPQLHVLKIDVEGSEVQVIEGASAHIDRFRPAIFLENDRRDRSNALISSLFDRDYRLWWHFAPLFQPDNYNGNPDNVMGRLMSINMLALPKERASNVVGLRPITHPDDWWHQNADS